MKIADFFIDRPIFAAVVSIVITIIGAPCVFLKTAQSANIRRFVASDGGGAGRTYPGAEPQ